MSARLPVQLIKGSDPVLVSEAVSAAIGDAVGDGDRSLLVDEFDLDSAFLGSALDAAQTPAFLTDFRIVVVRRFGRYSKQDEVAAVVSYLEDPLETTTLILAWEKTALTSQSEHGEPYTAKPKVPPSLTKAVTAAGGEVRDTSPARQKGGWISDQLTAAGLNVDASARNLIEQTIGDDGGAVVGIIERLKGAYAPGTRLALAEVEPFVGALGGVPPWDLTDAIDKGTVVTALDQVQRMMGAGDRHALAVMATLQTHYLRMARLDGANVRGEKDAAALLGMKGSTFPAKKAMNQSRKLGAAKLRRSLELLAQADVDLRGAQAWPDELVMEVLVARLARLSR